LAKRKADALKFAARKTSSWSIKGQKMLHLKLEQTAACMA
jgi:hypothetical protein